MVSRIKRRFATAWSWIGNGARSLTVTVIVYPTDGNS
jgi:hypothetical protein